MGGSGQDVKCNILSEEDDDDEVVEDEETWCRYVLD